MKLITKLFASLLFLIIFPFSITQAQNSDKINPLRNGSKALQFQISDHFNLASFSGTTFSYKRQLTSTQAKRIGLSLSNNYNWKNYPDSENSQETSHLDLYIRTDYTWMNYTNPESDIKFFYGYGPGIRVRLKRSVEEANRKYTDQHTFYGIAGIGYAGVEWFFQSSMSLHAEYQASVQVNHSRFKSTSTRSGNKKVITKHNINSIDLSGDGVKFGLSVYF